ncbi:MAG: dihydropyrimidinase [Bacteroidales bacterium]|nr:dihydropyrimidinase [Bacteroidales bacterium]
MSILIKNAVIFDAEKAIQTDILLSEGGFLEIGQDIKKNADRVIDATGKYVFPGGIDPHVHFHLPTPAGFSADDFASGSKAALFGGTTTIIDFVTPQRGQSLIEALELRIQDAKDSLVDYSFHISPVDWRPSLEEEIRECVRRGFPSFKIYLAYRQSIGIDEETMYKVMQIVAKAGGMLTAHCELGEEVDRLRNEFASKGNLTPFYHAQSRPPYTESEAVEKAIKAVEKTGCPLYIVHVSSTESLHHIRKAQQKGLPVMAETCPHYLLLNDDKYMGDFEETCPFVLSPPLRKFMDSEMLWKALADGTLQTVGTDHCPFSMKQKAFGKNDFRLIPNGAGGVEHRMELLYTHGVLQNRMSKKRFAEVTSSAATSIFSLETKGKILVGADADLIIWNPETQKIISAKNHHSACDNSIYEGFSTKGSAEFVFKGGELIIEDGKLLKHVPGKLVLRKAKIFGKS